MTQLNKQQLAFARALFDTYTSGTPLDEEDWQNVVTDDDTAYAVQDEVMRLKGLPVGGYKVSLTSAQTQKMFDSTSPLYGAQVAHRFLPAPAMVYLADQMEPLVEVELAFRAKEDLSSNDSLADFLRKTTVAGTLEVPDSRFKNWFPSLNKYNVMADCAVGGLVVYGKELPSDQVFSDVDEAAKVTTQLFHDGEKLDEGQSSEVLDNPLNSLQWLVNKLESQGKRFKQEQVVSSGTFVLPPKLTSGDWLVKFDHGLGNVELNVK